YRYKWWWHVGDPSVFMASINCHLEVHGSHNAVSCDGYAHGGGTILGHKVNVLEVNAHLFAPRLTKKLNAQIRVNLLRHTIYNKHLAPYSTLFNKIFNCDNDWYHHIIEARFKAGPIPVKVTLGIRAHVGVHFYIGLRPIAVDGKVKPGLDTTLYASGGPD